MGFFNKIFGKKKNENLEKDKELNKKEELKNDIELEENIKNSQNNEEIIEKDKHDDRDIINQEQNLEKDKKNIFSSLKDRLIKSREGLFGTLKNIFTNKTVIDGEMYEELEDTLVQSDIGIEMTLKIVKDLKNEIKKQGIRKAEEVYPLLKIVLGRYLITEDVDLEIEPNRMNVILIVGVNGVGKTTTIGKIASKLVKDGKKVVIGAADTFRAAAVEQLEEWANRAGAEIVKHNQGSDPGAVVYDTLSAGESKKADVVIIDTAGRLHNKENLMKELEKINNIIKKKIGNQSYETILVLDGTTGQNGLAQARVFNTVTKLTGFIVTKLDGTAKGGIVFSISEELKKPIKYIGIGEGIEDLRPFNSKEYIEAIFD